jgi:selenocysteine-specific elongation factor
MLIATAGHIDHGKTALIRALTGVETDRLPEERTRGISIDLGFAYWRPADTELIGFVDVPGHERYIRNMLAGVGGVDFALLVVAADDGVMPQTIEHVQILDLLGIARGAVAITKCDRVAPARISEVRNQVTALLKPTLLSGAALFEVSSLRGDGIPALSQALRREGCATSLRQTSSRNFRLAIDRAFSVTGAGTVVTGTVRDGELQSGERLIVAPRGQEVRVRALHIGGMQVQSVKAGERCALNLSGIEVSDVHRGDWLVVPEMHAPTQRLEVRLKVKANRTAPLKHQTPVHLHIGTSDSAARVFIRSPSFIPPGEDAVVQLVLDRETCAVSGDRFVVRDQSGQHTIGGGHVIDPFVSGARRKGIERAAISAALEVSYPLEALKALLALPCHEVDTGHFARSFNLRPGTAAALYAAAGAIILGADQRLALPAARVTILCSEILDCLGRFHLTNPDVEGVAPRELMKMLSTSVSEHAFRAIQKNLIEKRQIEISGNVIKRQGHVARYSAFDSALWIKALPWLEARGVLPFTVRDLARELRTTETALLSLLHRRRLNGDIWRITETRFMLHDQVAALAASAARLHRDLGGKGFTAAQYRDAAGIGRTLTIQVLEFFDQLGFTKRRGDMRQMHAGYETVFGRKEPDLL